MITLPAGRSLVSAQPVAAEDGGGVLLICGCGTSTHLVFEFSGSTPGRQEVAYACDGCSTAHWFTIGPAASGGGEAESGL